MQAKNMGAADPRDSENWEHARVVYVPVDCNSLPEAYINISEKEFRDRFIANLPEKDKQDYEKVRKYKDDNPSIKSRIVEKYTDLSHNRVSEILIALHYSNPRKKRKQS